MKPSLKCLFFTLAVSMTLSSCSATNNGEIYTPPAEITTEQSDFEEVTEYVEVEECVLLKQQISTVDEAIAYLDSKHSDLMMSAHGNNPETDPHNFWTLCSGAETVVRQNFECVGRSDIVQALTYLLDDNLEIYTVIGFAHSECGGIPMRAINCIKTATGYQFIDPVLKMQGDLGSRYGTKLPEATVSSIEDYVELCQSIPGLSLYIDYLYLFSDSEKFQFVEDSQGISTLIPRENSRLLWDNTAKNKLTPAQFQQLRISFIDPQYIDTYDISSHLGGTTLTPESAKALVDAQPEVAKEQVKTAADLLMYMLAADIQPCNGCYCDEWNGDVWHTNMNARQVMQTKLGNCGSCANLANYLLEGDYEEIGFIDHAYNPGEGGSHVYNYIFHEGKYYIVDFSSYLFSNYNAEFDHPVPVLDSLDEWVEASQKGVFQGFYPGICLITAYTSSGQQLPVIFGKDNCYYFPEGADYTLLYDSGNGYKMAEKAFDNRYYDWTVFWSEKDRTPIEANPSNPDNSVVGDDWELPPSANVDPANISKYDLYNHLGGITLTPEAAKALVDAQPEVVKEQVKTAADLLMYMMAANIQACDGCYCDEWDGNLWHTNMNARQVMQTKLGNCGSCANLANYLLEGDYTEIGFMDHAYYPGEGGSHVYNYIFHEEKYYIVDFSWYLFGNYAPDLSYPIPVMDSLEEWSWRIKEDVFLGYYPNVNIIVSYTSSGQQLPVIFGDDKGYYFPTGTEYIVWYEAADGFHLSEKPLNKSYYDWTVFWAATDRTPKNAAYIF